MRDRVARRERERLALKDARLRRVRIEGELRGTVLGRSRAVRHRLGGRSGRVNVEVASDHYDAGRVGAEIAAGFRSHTSGARAERMVARLRSGGTEL